MVEGIGGRSLPLRMPQELPGGPHSSGASGLARPRDAQGGAENAGSTGFGETLKEFLGEVNGLQQRSDQVFQAFVRGEATDLHQVVLAQQEAAIAVRLVTEMRDRMLQAYQEVMRTTM